MQQLRAPVERMQKASQKFIEVSGLKKIAEGFQWIARTAAAAFRSIASIIPALGAITAAGTIAGMARLVSHWVDWGKAIREDADRLGVSTQALEGWQTAAKLVGASSQDATDAISSLSDATAQAMRGNAEMVAAFQRAGIAFQDTNGQMRTGADVMKDVFARLDSLKLPADRAAESARFLGTEQSKLYLAYRASGLSLQDFMDLQKRAEPLTDAQQQSLRRMGMAQASLGVSFDNLGKNIGAMLAKHFAPLLEQFDKFVQKHTPDILRVLEELTTGFSNWVSGIKWDDIKDGITWIRDTLREILAIMKTLKEYWDSFKSVGDYLNRISRSVDDAGKATHDWIIRNAERAGIINRGSNPLVGPSTPLPGAPWWSGGAEAPPAGIPQEGPRHGPHQTNRPHGGGPRMPAGNDNVGPQSAAPGTMNLPEGQQNRLAGVRDRLAADLGMTPAAASGIVGNLQGESGMQAIQEINPIRGRGGFGWAQWTGPRRVAFEAYAREHNLDPRSDEANYGYLRQELQSPEYRNMIAQLRARGMSAQQASDIVLEQFERPLDPNQSRAARQRNAARIAARPPVAPPAVAAAMPAAGPPAAMPAPQQPVTGQVDVNITNRNPPPNQSVTASASGAANVSPPRVEYGQLATI